MCEPNHSINQWPSNDSGSDHGLMFGLKKAGEWLKKFGSWWHLSLMGKGHHEGIEWAGTNGLILPKETRYEVKWWNRTISIDGKFYGEEGLRELALDEAERYARTVSIGNLTTLRRFLETSLLKTERPQNYIYAFTEYMVVKNVRDTVTSRLRKLIITSPIESVVKAVLGYTRKRELLVPEWSDDTELWAPQVRSVKGTPNLLLG